MTNATLIKRTASLALAIGAGITFVGAGAASAAVGSVHGPEQTAPRSAPAGAAGLTKKCRPKRNHPCITGVTFTGTPADPTVTVTGSGFGTAPVGSSVPANCGASGEDYTGSSLSITDGWHAGMVGDCIGLTVSSYTNTQIVFGLGNWYDSSNSSSSLNPSDSFTVGVAHTSYSGTVSYNPSISGVTFTGTPADPTVTVTGSGFGTAPVGSSVPANCGASGEDYTGSSLSITDGWHAGMVGDCIGLTVSSYTNTQIVFGLGNWYDSSNSSSSLNPSDSFTVVVNGLSFSGDVSYSA